MVGITIWQFFSTEGEKQKKSVNAHGVIPYLTKVIHDFVRHQVNIKLSMLSSCSNTTVSMWNLSDWDEGKSHTNVAPSFQNLITDCLRSPEGNFVFQEVQNCLANLTYPKILRVDPAMERLHALMQTQNKQSDTELENSNSVKSLLLANEIPILLAESVINTNKLIQQKRMHCNNYCSTIAKQVAIHHKNEESKQSFLASWEVIGRTGSFFIIDYCHLELIQFIRQQYKKEADAYFSNNNVVIETEHHIQNLLGPLNGLIDLQKYQSLFLKLFLPTTFLPAKSAYSHDQCLQAWICSKLKSYEGDIIPSHVEQTATHKHQKSIVSLRSTLNAIFKLNDVEGKRPVQQLINTMIKFVQTHKMEAETRLMTDNERYDVIVSNAKLCQNIALMLLLAKFNKIERVDNLQIIHKIMMSNGQINLYQDALHFIMFDGNFLFAYSEKTKDTFAYHTNIFNVLNMNSKTEIV